MTESSAMDDDADVLIIGAGAAGLAAARTLTAERFSVTILEARNRIGGRVHTLHDSRSSLPIELGAEFIHGRSSETFDIVARARLKLVEVPTRHWYLDRQGLTDSGEFWRQLEDVMDQMKRVGPEDQSFHEFLETYCRSRDLGEAKTIASMYVEGFHAARMDRISVLGLNKVNEAADSIDGDKGFRITNGYDLLVQSLYDEAVSQGAQVRLTTVVEEVRWSRGRVEVTSSANGASHRSQAERVLVTLPLGVLQADLNQLGSVRFVPTLPEKDQAARKLAMGDAVRLMLRFRAPFWERLKLPAKDGSTKDLAQMAFIHAPQEAIPSWWTQSPARAPLLVGWAGGPRAEKLSRESKQTLIDRGLDTLARIFLRARKEIEELLEESYTHDWHGDPFCRGSYSYIPVGGLEAEAQLAQPVDETLFFAGEATNTDGHIGTVHGAIATGLRAAQEIIKAAKLKR
ncbi:MAG TPA: NAD(P)/FAD-dependent oxidoreductase [Pyrinomonadaceae bacterium]|nr:NAD(P)/FAD-dependent oxidoreductase [Pyrinomonadaceae bacterium]